MMNFDEYWNSLVDRVHQQKEKLTGVEEAFYRLSGIFGETMVGGVQGYFAERTENYAEDMKMLREHGFENIAQNYESAKIILFGDIELTKEVEEERFLEICEDEALEEQIDERLRPISVELWEQLESLYDYKNQFGIKHKLYSE